MKGARWTNDDLRDYELRRKTAGSDKAAIQTTNLEQDSRHGALAKKAVKGFDTQVSIHILSKRYRLCDADGISAKAVIDGLVHETVIANDSQKEVSEVSYSQEKIKKDIQEETILTITEG